MEPIVVKLFQTSKYHYRFFINVLTLLYSFNAQAFAEKNQILDLIWMQNFNKNHYIGMPESEILAIHSDVIKRKSITKSKLSYIDLIQKVSPEMFFWYRSVDGKIQSFQVLEKNPKNLYLLGEKSSFGEATLSELSVENRESLRMTNEQVTYIQSVNLLAFKGSNIRVAYSSGPEEKNLIIFDQTIFSFDDFFAPSSEQARFNNHIKNLKRKHGLIESSDDKAMELHSPELPNNEIYIFRPETDSDVPATINQVESGDVIVEKWKPNFKWLYAVLSILSVAGLFWYFYRKSSKNS